MEKQIAQRIVDGLTTQNAVDDVGNSLDMAIDEYCKFQELKSLAVLEDRLTIDEGMTIYNCLGNSVETFNNQPVHVKSVLTSLFMTLMQSAAPV